MSDSAYNAYDADINRRLEHAETRIKYWVIAGICANLVVLIGMGIPLVYYLGTLSAQSTASTAVVSSMAVDIKSTNRQVLQLRMRQAAMENYLEASGYKIPEPVGE